MEEIFEIARILVMATLSFLLALVFTPILLHFLYRFKIGKQIRMEGAPIYNQLHQKKEGTPIMGGILVWFTVLVLAVFFWGMSQLGFNSFIHQLNFLDRAQTLLPLGVLVASAIVGLGDDILGAFRIGPKGGGLPMRYRILMYTLISSIGAWWFYFKLGFSEMIIPFVGGFDIGIWYILFFIFVVSATAFSANEADGLDGLAGGCLIVAFAAYGVIAFFQGKYHLATFDVAIMGALAAFLWFNIYPAKFFMGDTGVMSLGITLGVMAMLTKTAILLPLFCIVLVIESLSVIIQMTSKKLRHGKKIFISTPIHHHFEAKGWPEAQITMRFWILSAIGAIFGLIIYFMDKFI